MLIAVFAFPASTTTAIAGVAAVATLLLQLAAVRPLLKRRTAAVLAGEDAARSRAHLVHIAQESVKVATVLTGGLTSLPG